VSTVRKLRHFRNALTYLIALMLLQRWLAAINRLWRCLCLGNVRMEQPRRSASSAIILTVFAIPAPSWAAGSTT